MEDIKKVLELAKTLLREYKINSQYDSIFYLTTALIDNDVFCENDYYNIYFRIEWLISAYNIGFSGDSTDFLRTFAFYKFIFRTIKINLATIALN